MKESIQYPFLFFGAGNATYNEPASFILRFRNVPTAEQKATIMNHVPAPLTIKNDHFNGKMMIVNVNEGDALTGAVAGEAFEKTFTKWLHEIHAVSPVEFVFRDVDDEEGGTKLSDWHAYSIKQVGKLVKQWEAEPGIFTGQRGELELFRQSACCIVLWAEFEDDDIEIQLRELIVPQSKLLKLLLAGDINDIHDYLKKVQEEGQPEVFREIFQETINGFCEEFCTEMDVEGIYKFRSLFSREFLLEGYIGEFIYAAYLQKDDKLIAQIIKELDDPDETIDQLGDFVYNEILQEEHWEAAIALYDIILTLIQNHGCNDLSILCNALYVLQNDNTGIPINKELNRKFLKVSLTYAPQNPAIYFNAACLYVEMKEFDQTLKCIQLAKEHKYDGYEDMMMDIAREDIFVEFMQYPPFQTWNR